MRRRAKLAQNLAEALNQAIKTAPPKSGHFCDQCSKECTSEHGLKVHKARAHK